MAKCFIPFAKRPNLEVIRMALSFDHLEYEITEQTVAILVAIEGFLRHMATVSV